MKELRRLLVDGQVVVAAMDEGQLRAPDGRTFSADEVVHLPPVEPSKIICTHLNYRSRLKELGGREAAAPTYFHKPVSSLNSHAGAVIRPEGCRFLNYEGEVAIVVGRLAKNIHPDDAAKYIRGYTIANDFGLHDFRDADMNSMVRVKGADTLGPVGPGLVEGWDFRSKRIQTLVNGQTVQDSNTDEMLWDMHYLIADLARHLTLVPGDLIFSGTPSHSRPIDVGDVVEVRVEGLGALRNTIAEGPAPTAVGVGAQPTSSDEVLGTALGSDFHAPRRDSQKLVKTTAEGAS